MLYRVASVLYNKILYDDTSGVSEVVGFELIFSFPLVLLHILYTNCIHIIWFTNFLYFCFIDTQMHINILVFYVHIIINKIKWFAISEGNG